ncbi:MAG: phosphotransferase [Acidimicrobiia bacterium]|nr:phosphotransferase [Acidimicrobiia bacterium]
MKDEATALARETSETVDEVLPGGVANAGAVVRSGDHVLRPSNHHSPSVHRFLGWLREQGFDGASCPVGIDPDGRERLEFIEGDVPIPPYPAWAQTDEALASAALLVRRLHDVSAAYDTNGSSWNHDLADPQGGPVMGHNDICLENVVFRDGVAVGLLDFDYAAPARRTYDLAQFARMCVPVDDDVNAARLGWSPASRPSRLRLVADAHDLDRAERAELLAFVDASIRAAGGFVRRRVEAGAPGFVAMWNDMGGQERFDRRARWWDDQADEFAVALR